MPKWDGILKDGILKELLQQLNSQKIGEELELVSYLC